MDVFTTVWSAQAEYKAFYDILAQTFSLVTNYFTNDATCLAGTHLLLAVRQGDGRFCDLELALTEENAAKLIGSKLPSLNEHVIHQSVATYDVVCNVQIPVNCKWVLDYESRHLCIVLHKEAPDRVFRLGQNAVWLGLVRDLLGVIYVGDLTSDPAGHLESAWIQLHSAGVSAESAFPENSH